MNGLINSTEIELDLVDGLEDLVEYRVHILHRKKVHIILVNTICM